MNIEQIRKDVETILGREWLYYDKGVVTYQTIIAKEYPHIDIDFLCSLYDDHRGWQDEIIREYIEAMEDDEGR